MLIQSIIVIVTILLLAVIIFLFLKYKQTTSLLNATKERFKDVINVDEEISKQQTTLNTLAAEYKSKENEYRAKFLSLDGEYTKSKLLFDELKKELALLEETSEIHSFGLYSPHYSFVTSSEYKDKLETIYEKQKAIIQADKAVISEKEWTVNGSKTEGRKMTKHYSKLMLRAFNGECDGSISKIKWNNINTMEERIKKSYEMVNKLGTTHNISISSEYLNLRLEELHLCYELQEKLQKEKEEQRRIQEQIREEEKVQKEIEEAQKQAQDEEDRYQKALTKAKSEIDKAKGKELQNLREQLKELETKLKEAQELKQRAMSRAQMTKSGHVYIISNIGSFGENVYKIGMTRRLEPFDRVRELGDASVPFTFDVHAMIYSDNAPELESKVHQYFENKRVNMVNERKEFFTVNIEEIKRFADENNIKVIFTELGEARQYRESKAKREALAQKKDDLVSEEKYPNRLVDISSLGL